MKYPIHLLGRKVTSAVINKAQLTLFKDKATVKESKGEIEVKKLAFLEGMRLEQLKAYLKEVEVDRQIELGKDSSFHVTDRVRIIEMFAEKGYHLIDSLYDIQTLRDQANQKSKKSGSRDQQIQLFFRKQKEKGTSPIEDNMAFLVVDDYSKKKSLSMYFTFLHDDHFNTLKQKKADVKYIYWEEYFRISHHDYNASELYVGIRNKMEHVIEFWKDLSLLHKLKNNIEPLGTYWQKDMIDQVVKAHTKVQPYDPLHQFNRYKVDNRRISLVFAAHLLATKGLLLGKGRSAKRLPPVSPSELQGFDINKFGPIIANFFRRTGTGVNP